jgi:hypothetical protein
MDLKAVSDQDGKAHRLTRAGMMICFIVAGVVLVATLAMTPSSIHRDDQPFNRSLLSK